MSKIKNGGLHQYGAEPFEQQQYGTAGAEEVNIERINNRFFVLHFSLMLPLII